MEVSLEYPGLYLLKYPKHEQSFWYSHKENWY